MKILHSFLFCLLVAHGMAQPPVDGWSKGKGNIDAVVSYSYESYSKYYAGYDMVSLGRKTQGVSLYAAAGLAEWLDVQMSVPYVITQPGYSGLQDFSSYLKARAINKNLSAGGSLTMFTSLGFLAPMTAYETESLFAIGQQATAFDIRGIVQFKHTTGFFVMGQSGYTIRVDPVTSSLPAALKMGLAKSKYYFDVWVDFQHAFGGSDYRDGSNSSFRTFGVSYAKIGASFYRPFKGGKSGIALGGSYVLGGRNIGKAYTGALSFIKKFSVSK